MGWGSRKIEYIFMESRSDFGREVGIRVREVGGYFFYIVVFREFRYYLEVGRRDSGVCYVFG